MNKYVVTYQTGGPNYGTLGTEEGCLIMESETKPTDKEAVEYIESRRGEENIRIVMITTRELQ